MCWKKWFDKGSPTPICDREVLYNHSWACLNSLANALSGIGRCDGGL